MSATLPAALEPLRAVRCWVLWKRELVKDRWTKVPYTSHRHKAKTDDPSTWRTFDKLQHGNGFDGPGLVLGDELQGVDLDVCIDADGVLEQWAEEVITRLDSYTETSPSGRGLKVFCYGPPGKSSEVSFGKLEEIGQPDKKRRELAYFTGARYFTVTGNVWLDKPLRKISDGDAQWLRERIKAKRDSKKAAPSTAARSGGLTVSAHSPGLVDLIVNGAPEGADRSERFFHAVRWAADSGLTAAEITSWMEQHPNGIGAKYAGRLAAEVARCLDGYTPKVHKKPGQAAKSAAAPAAPADPDDFADFANPVDAAQTLVGKLYTAGGRRVLHFWQGEFHEWTGTHYVVLPLADVREVLYRIGAGVSKAPVKKRTVDDVLDALKAAANLSHRTVPSAPAWIDPQPGEVDARAVIPLRNGVLRIEDEALLPPTPRLFVPYCLPCDYSAAPPQPLAWHEFLHSVWPTDPESIASLQEWLGYLLTADTGQQKGLMLVGPRRSGKGTIGRVIVRLLGERNVASPTLASLGNTFGLEPLIGKTAALMSDARLGKKADIASIAENLLRLTGEDAISVDRKFREAYTAKLLTRIIVLTNEVPVFRDAAAALPSRFILLRTEVSFYGREDHTLDARLAAELQGILAWALEGLRRLRARGRFLQPASSMTQLRMMEEMASPCGTFMREECVVEPGAQVPVRKLYDAWRDWCKEHGRDQPGTEQTFGRDVAAAAPWVRLRRPRINGERVRIYGGLRLRNPDDPPEGGDDDDDE